MNTVIRRTAKGIQYSVLAASIIGVVGCAATGTMIEHRTLESQTRLSKTIFLDPVSSNQKTIFIVVKNTSDLDMDIEHPLANALRAHGYTVTKNPSQAHYLLQANILKIGKMSVAASQNALGGEYGSSLAGAVTGGAIGAFSGNSTVALAGGLAGGVIGLAADSLVKRVNYTMITDVQISERVAHGVNIKEQFNANLDNGTASSLHQTSNRQSPYERYRTRIVSNADRVNLSFAVARPALEQGLVKTLSGIF